MTAEQGQLEPYLAAIRAYAPDLEIASAELNSDGMVNAVVIVNGELAFRFPKGEWGRALQRYEAALLAAIRGRLPVAAPEVEAQTEEFALYRFLPGEPLYRHTLLQMSAADQEIVLEQLGALLAALHAAPLGGLPTPPWERGGAPKTARARALERLEQARQLLYPHLWRDQRAWVEHLHAPVADGSLDLDAFAPRLIHADLASYHLLVQPDPWRLTGVLDFGTAGPGDPAVDLATLLNSYGESVIRRLDRAYPIELGALDRARFMSAALELEWALAGVRGNDPSMYLVHLGRARDAGLIGGP